MSDSITLVDPLGMCGEDEYPWVYLWKGSLYSYPRLL